MTMISVPRRTSAMASRSFRSMVPPVGLEGKGSTSTLVLSVMADFNSSGVRRNSFSAFRVRYLGTPPAISARGP